MLRRILGFGLDSVGDSEVGETYGVRLGVCDLLVDGFCGEEVELLELLHRSILLHIKFIIYQAHEAPKIPKTYKQSIYTTHALLKFCFERLG